MFVRRVKIHAIVASLTLASACGNGAGSGNKKTQAPSTPEFVPEALTPPAPRTIVTAKGWHLQIAPERAEQINPKLVYVFQGKGTTLSWDIGVARAAWERIPLLRSEAFPAASAAGEVLLTGNSSGSALAAFFTCNGISMESILRMGQLLSAFPEELVREDSAAKIPEIFNAIRNGQEFGRKHDAMLPFIDQLTGAECMPRYPTVIVASNQDINDNRPWLESNEHRSRTFHVEDFSYSERTSTFTTKSFKVGKICTYFADPVMFRYLTEQMTQEERLCDVRVMETAADVKLAVLASIAEPTYFVPVAEPFEAKLERYHSDGFAKTRRFYNGGFSMPGVVQDMKRLFPSARALGTGRWEYGMTEVAAMNSWYDVNLNTVQANSRWWLDLETFPAPGKELDALLARPQNLQGASLVKRYQDEIAMGYRRGIECLKQKKPCLSTRKTVMGRDLYKPALTRPAGQPGGAEIKTRQGLDPLLQ
ncbi:MAG: hypothetical protein RIQ81_1790 [Pseudomonadota bacterium]|jgi:hypothetical protein